jgi:outer membrane usher protein
VQANAARATVGAEYARTGSDERAPGLARVFVAGSVGAVEGTWFAARPVQDSFALIRLPGVEGVPVHANGWYVGDTDANGAVVATNIASYYDNFISFDGAALPLDHRFDASEIVISPPARSGTRVEFAVRRQRALTGVLVARRDGAEVPLEFREIELARDGRTLAGFTARRGEFWFDDIEPGRYRLRLQDSTPCEADVVVPDGAGPTTDVGRVVCERSGS